MSYSNSSPIVGQGAATASEIESLMQAKGRALAPNFAPDQTYKSPPDGIGDAIIRWSREFGVNHDLVAADICHESAGWQSRIVRDKNNPSGLGAINSSPYESAITFATPAEGCRATAAHMASYARGDGAWTRYDPRYTVIRDNGWLGIATSLSGLDGRWASPGVGYGGRIAAAANDLLAFGGESMAFEMPSSINGIPVRKSFIPATNRNRPGTPANAEGLRWITVHETANPTVGANAEMHRRFTHGGGGAGGDNDGVSFTFCVDDHEIVWLLPLEEKSWQASDGSDGPGNSSASIEACVNVDGVWNRTKENLAQLVAFLGTNAPGRSIDRVAQHNKWARDGKNCPTRLRANNGAEWLGLMGRIREITTAMPAPPGGADPVTGKFIATEFRAYYDGRGGLDIFGRPVTGAFNEDGRLVQYFERMEMQHFPENDGTPYEVQLRLLGAEEMTRRYPAGAPA